MNPLNLGVNKSLWKVAFLVCVFTIIIAGTANSEYYYEKSARGGALGYGFSALADEPSGVFYNPAGIGFLGGMQFTAMFDRISKYGMLNSNENPYSGNFGAYRYFENFGTAAFHFYQMGSFASDTKVQTTNNATFSYARQFNPKWSGGLNLKYIFESNYGKRSTIDFDMGMIYKVNEIINLGFVAENIFHSELTPVYFGAKRKLDRSLRGAMTYTTDSSEEPTIFAFSTGMKQQYVVGESKTYGLGSMGVEQWFRNDLPFSWALRGSYTLSKENDENLRQFGFGFSLRFNNGINTWRFDYSYQQYPFEGAGVAAGNHTIAAVFGIGASGGNSRWANSDVPNEEQLSEEYADLKPTLLKPEAMKTEQPTPQKRYVTPPPQNDKWNKMALSGRVENLSTSGRLNFMFLLTPADTGEPFRWKLYINNKRPAPTDLNTIEKRSFRIIEGKGMVPGVIVWDGKSSDNNRTAKSGKYYYSMVVWDTDGEVWRSEWSEFKVR
ncbi:MAG: hypothetical protein GY855_05715 [candidate division Zixibacteria bacterium]|nr:hypothetical protein [candidate division Zixibacteria bacterium]